MPRLTSLRQRLYVWLLLPVAALLLGLGVSGFYYARSRLFEQWNTSAMFALERAAHSMDMLLERPAEAVNLINEMAAEQPLDASQWKELLARTPGVAKVALNWNPEYEQPPLMPARGMGAARASRGMGRGMRFHQARIARVASPRFDASAGQDTVLMVFELKDQAGRTLGRLELAILFNHLLKDLKALEWWQSEGGCLVDETGRILARTGGTDKNEIRLGDDGGELKTRVLQALLTKRSGTLLGQGHPAERVAGFYRLSKAPWTLVVIAPGEKVLQPVIRFLRTYVAAGVACVAVVLILIRLVTGQVASSVRATCQAARRVAQGDYEVKVPDPNTNDELHRLAESFNTMVEGLKEKEFIRDTFGRYMDPEIARQLISEPGATRLGGQKRWVAVMMSDVRGFTALCETLSPEETIAMVNNYLSSLIEVIQKHRGIIVDFLGDAVLAFFDSLGLTRREAARRALCCALELRETADRFNQAMRDQGKPRLATAFGLNGGEVVVGNIGSQTRAKYGIVGGPVNLTSRIQAQAEGGEIVVSQALYDLLPQELAVTRSFAARLKGVENETRLYVVDALDACAELASGAMSKPQDPEGGSSHAA